jgi:hypothetical protein
MGFWDRFGGKKGGSGAGADAMPAVRWLSAQESPFGVRTLDLRPVTQGMRSTTTDPCGNKRLPRTFSSLTVLVCAHGERKTAMWGEHWGQMIWEHLEAV